MTVLKIGPIGCPETSVTNYQFKLCKIPEQQRPHLHSGRNLKSRSNAVISVEIQADIPKKISDIQRICKRNRKISLKSAIPGKYYVCGLTTVSSAQQQFAIRFPPLPKPVATACPYQTHARIRISDSSVSLTNCVAIL